jgi:hypothetical protein
VQRLCGTEQSATQRLSDHDVIADFYGEHAILSVIFNELAKDAAARGQNFGQPRWQFAKTYRRRNQRVQVIIVQKPHRGGEALLGRPSPAARSGDLPDLTGNKTQSFAAPDEAPIDCDLVFHASATAGGLATAIACAGEEATVVELSWYAPPPRCDFQPACLLP